MAPRGADVIIDDCKDVKVRIRVIPGAYSVVRVDEGRAAEAGDSASFLAGLFASGGFVSVTKTDGELSVVCESTRLPPALPRREEGGWSLLAVEGPLDFSLTGILSAISAPLASAGISIFAVSTYDTDYVLVRAASLAAAEVALAGAGFEVIGA